MKLPPTHVPSASPADLFILPPTSAPDGQVEFGCRLVVGAHADRHLWFRFPEEIAPRLTSRADPFVIATLIYAMGRVRRLRVHGAVSEGLLANLADFQTAFASYHGRPAGELVEIFSEATAEPDAIGRNASGITAFSGGVDSCFSVYRHSAFSALAPKRFVGAALMMHGFDIPLAQTAVFSRSAARARLIADDAGIRLFTGATNVRTLPVPWVETFATAIAASLSFFQPEFAFGLIPSCQDWSHARFDNGSNPLTDPLLSSLSFQIVHDGTAAGRIEKLRELVNWPAAMEHLRVCWQGEALDRNCCRCEKCLRTMLMLRLGGATQPPAFPEPIDLRQLDRLVIESQGGIDEFGYLLEEARRLGKHEPWMKPVARVIERSVRQQRLRRRGRTLAARMPSWMASLARSAGRRLLSSGVSFATAPDGMAEAKAALDAEQLAPELSCGQR